MTRSTLMQRINARLAAQRNGEGGLALLDVLLGMAIFALIAVIAVQAMGQFRERAFVTQATSDAKQVGTGIEAAMTEPNAVFASKLGVTVGTASAIDAAVLSDLGVNLTSGNTATYVSGDRDDYIICVANAGAGKSVSYSAAAGAIGGVHDNTTCA